MALQDLKQAIPAGHRKMLVTEVTRMKKNNMVCVAGIDIHTGKMIRPLQPGGVNWPQAEWADKDFMRVGNVLMLEPAAPSPSDKPHATEDFNVSMVTVVAKASPAQVFAACEETADAGFSNIFGDHLIDDKYVEEYTDCRSLGCLVVDAADVSVSSSFGKITLVYDDDHHIRHYLKVTELTFAAQDQAAADALSARIAGHDRIALRIGLPRAWDGPDRNWDPLRCYMQLNGVIVPA